MCKSQELEQKYFPRRLLSLGGLKAIALLLIFWWHSPLPNPPVDLGARCCEFFFVASGFLFAYNHYAKKPDTIRYLEAKLTSIYPIYLLTFLAEAIILVSSRGLNTGDLINAVLSLFMLQSWSPFESVFWSYNGASWFVASLMFCYLVGCLTIASINRMKKACWALLLFALIRFALEYIQIKYYNQYFVMNVHVNPLVRSMEFCCGMATGAILKSLKERRAKIPAWIFSATELVLLTIVVWSVIKMNNVWMRAEYVYLFCALVFVFSFDGGIVSRLLSVRPLVWFGKIQLEFYLIHTIVCKVCQPLITWSHWNWFAEAASICFCVTMGCVMLYRLVFRKVMENGMIRMASFIRRIVN